MQCCGHLLYSPGNGKNIPQGVKDSKQSEPGTRQEEQRRAKERQYEAETETDRKALHSGTPAEAVVINHLTEETGSGSENQQSWLG